MGEREGMESAINTTVLVSNGQSNGRTQVRGVVMDGTHTHTTERESAAQRYYGQHSLSVYSGIYCLYLGHGEGEDVFV